MRRHRKQTKNPTTKNVHETLFEKGVVNILFPWNAKIYQGFWTLFVSLFFIFFSFRENMVKKKKSDRGKNEINVIF